MNPGQTLTYFHDPQHTHILTYIVSFAREIAKNRRVLLLRKLLLYFIDFFGMASGSCEIKTEYAEDIENWTSDLRMAREQVMIIFKFS